MAPTVIPIGEPDDISAGDAVVFDIPNILDAVYGTFASGDGWVLAYQFVAGTASQRVTAQAQVDGWRVNLTGAQTRNLKADDLRPETVQWVATVTKGGESYTVRNGVLILAPNLWRLTDGSRPFANQALDLVNAEILKRLRQDVSAVSAQQRQVQREELRYLEALRGKYSREIAAARSGGFGAEVKFRLRDATP